MKKSYLSKVLMVLVVVSFFLAGCEKEQTREIPMLSSNGSNGYFIEAWSQKNSSVVADNGIYARIYTPGKGWSGTVQVDGNKTSLNGLPNFLETGIDSNGNAVVIWTKGGFKLTMNYFKNGSGWQGSKLVQDGDILLPKACMSADGKVFAAWSRRSGSNNEFHQTIKTFSYEKGWSQSVELYSDINAWSTPESIAASANGDAYIIWEEDLLIPGERTIMKTFGSRFTDNTWGAPFELYNDQTGSNFDLPEVTTDSNGNALFVLPLLGNAVYARFYNVDSGLGEIVRIDNPAEVGGPFGPEVALSDDGTAIVVWKQALDGRCLAIQGARFDGSKWLATENIDYTATGDLLFPEVAIDAEGNALVAYRQHENGAYRMASKRFVPANGWSSKFFVDNGNANNAEETIVSASADGTFLVVWKQQDKSTWNIVDKILTPSN